MADVVDCISNATKDKCKSFIVDAGGGKGYLSSRLALEYNLKVLGVDWNPQLTSTALTHSQKLNVSKTVTVSFRRNARIYNNKNFCFSEIGTQSKIKQSNAWVIQI